LKKRLGEILLERGLIDVDQLNSALAHQRQWGMRLGTTLVAKGFIAEGVLTRVLAESLGMPMVDLARIVVDHKALQMVPRRLCEQYDVFPIGLQEQQNGRRILLLAMADPLNATAIDEIGFTTDTIVKPAIAQISSLEQAVRRHYYGERVEVAPLAMHRGGTMPPESMTILTGQGEERVVGGATDVPAVVQLTDQVASEYRGQPAGALFMANGTVPGATGRDNRTIPVSPADILGINRPADLEDIEAIEKKFWALMRILARRGLVTKEEFLAELRSNEPS
jgi:hypothetical protein